MTVVAFVRPAEVIATIAFRSMPLRFVAAPSHSLDLPWVVYRDVLAAFRVIDDERDIITPLLAGLTAARGVEGFGEERRLDGKVVLVSPPWVLGEIARAIGFRDDVWLDLVGRAQWAAHE
jgi:hypothetical protein